MWLALVLAGTWGCADKTVAPDNPQSDAGVQMQADASDTPSPEMDMAQSHDARPDEPDTSTPQDTRPDEADATPDAFVQDLTDEPDTTNPEAAPCPEGPFVSQCVFGVTSRQLRQSSALEVTEITTHATSQTMDEITGLQLVYGYGCEDIFTPQTPDEAVALTDDGVTVLRVLILATGGSYTWLRLYMGDTEVGYIFEEGTLTLAARISDQDVVACTVQ